MLNDSQGSRTPGRYQLDREIAVALSLRAIEELSIEAADSVVHHATIVLTPQERLVGSYRFIVRQAERSSAERDCRLFLDRG